MKKYAIAALVCASALALTACGDEVTENDTLPSGTIALTQTTADETEEKITETESSAETEPSEADAETVSESETTVTETTAVTEAETTISETTTVSASAVSETTTTITSTPETTAGTVPESTAPDYSSEPVSSFIINGVCCSAADNISVKDLGAQTAPVSEFPSCMGDGVDCIYSFDGFTVTMYRDGSGAESFMSLTVTGSTVTNPKGLNCGISEAEALAILGDYYIEENGVGISFIAENGIVTEVDYIKLI